jgi:hypothetical protein
VALLGLGAVLVLKVPTLVEKLLAPPADLVRGEGLRW